jgi:hypothetical protein
MCIGGRGYFSPLVESTETHPGFESDPSANDNIVESPSIGDHKL